MIMRHIDRSRSTGGGMAASFGIHGAVLLFLLLAVGHQSGTFEAMDELVEIAYIEATYGEDVAAQVQMKAPPRNVPQPPAPGVNTDSAFKPKPDADPGPPRPEPRAADPEPTPQPQLAQAKPKPKLQAAPQLTPKERPQVAMTEVKTPDVVVKQPQKTLATAAQLESSVPRPKNRQVIDANKLVGTAMAQKTLEAAAPSAAPRQTKGAFKPQSGGLKTKSGDVALGDDMIASAGHTRQQRGAIAETGSNLASGGGLQQTQQGTYQAPSAGLAPSSTKSGGKAGGKGVLDVGGPSGGGGTKSGRKTILNYGSGSGGGRGGGSLSTRQRIAEPAATNDIVATPKTTAEPKQGVADVKLGGKGVNMTISGQIKGRKVLHSVPPVYSAQAKKKGWEGVVAVHFTVKADGRVKDNMYFEQTSVHRDLNKAAMAAIKQFRFAPLPAGQAAVEQWGVITIVFKLN